MLQKSNKRLKKAFGVNELGMVDFPVRFSNTRISRLHYGDQLGCSWCFPHGWETENSRISKVRRNWKDQRSTQWKQNKSVQVKLSGYSAISSPKLNSGF